MFNSSVNKLLFSLVLQKPKYFFVALCLSLGSAILNLVSTVLLIPIIFVFFGNEARIDRFETIPLAEHFFKLFILNGTKSYLILVGVICLLLLFKNILNYLGNFTGFLYTKDLIYRLKTQELDLLSQVNINYYRHHRLDDVLAKFNRETERTALAAKSLHNLAIVSLVILLMSALLIAVSWQLSLITLGLILLIIWFYGWLIEGLRKIRIAAMAKDRFFNRQVVEFLAEIHSIKAVANESKASEEIARSLKEKNQQQLMAQAVAAVLKPTVEVSGIITFLIVGLSGYYLSGLPATAAAAKILIYLVILFRLAPFIGQFSSTKNQLLNTLPSVQSVSTFLQELDREQANNGLTVFSHLDKEIEFASVTFAYPNHAQILLNRFSLQISRGQTTALVGLLNGEKSLIIDLLLNLYRPIEGKILLDGNNIQDYDLASLRRAIAVVTPEPFLFNNSLAYNIAYGIDNISHTDIIAATKQAQIYEFITQLPAGFDTLVGERGITLLAEQRQKISIARAWLRNPQVLILDEPIDLPTDSESISAIITRLCHDRTTLILTKQLEFAKSAERIIVVNRSKIVQVGTHEKLLRQSGIYQRLYLKQFKGDRRSPHLKLAEKIARKLAQQTNTSLSLEISTSVKALLASLSEIERGLFEDESEHHRILDESYKSAKDMLLSLREYERKLSRESEVEDS